MRFKIILLITVGIWPEMKPVFKNYVTDAKIYSATNQIDSIYNSLIAKNADSILLYQELRNEIETEGMLIWKIDDSSFAQKFKTRKTPSRTTLRINRKITFLFFLSH